VQRADLRALAAKVRYVVDPANPYPKQFTGHLRVTLKNGSVMEARQGSFKGGADHPLTDADLQTKFFAICLHGGVAKPRADAILARVQQIFDAPVVELSLLGA
jgi:2-methylcitrate dehydratase PrpD